MASHDVRRNDKARKAKAIADPRRMEDDFAIRSRRNKDVNAIYSISLNIEPFTPQTGHLSGTTFSTVMPQTGQTK